MKEIEAKVRLDDESIIVKADLKKIKEVHVLDIYFDSPLLNFNSQDKVLRLRKENNDAYITYKGPREKHDSLVIREEIEPKISSFEDGLAIIKNIGFIEHAKAEKIRAYYSTQTYPSLSITVDKYPFIGLFIEIEGDEAEVHLFLKEFNLRDTIQKNCSELFLEHCKEHKILFDKPEKHFTFEDEKYLRQNDSGH